MTSVGFGRKASKTKKRALIGVDEVALALKNSFRYTDKWLPTVYRIERSFFMSNDDKSLSHTHWNCKDHIVFTPKYRRRVIYGELRKVIGRILRRLCEMKEAEIVEAHAMADHIPMLVRVPPKYSVSSFMGFLKGRSTTLIHEQHANLKYKYGNKSFWSKGYYVSTVGLNQKTIEKYIREQEADDRIRDSISKREYVDPFK
jgi:putative transposase